MTISPSGKILRCDECNTRAKIHAETEHMVKGIIKTQCTSENLTESYEIHRDAATILFGMSPFEIRDLGEEAIDQAMENTIDKKFEVLSIL